MARNTFKKAVHTKFVGGKGKDTWADRVKTTKAANKAFRKVKTA